VYAHLTTKTASKMLLLPAALLLGACNDNQPCSADCPMVGGVWFLSYVAPVFPCDGGTAGEPPMTVAFRQEASVLRATIDGVETRGTVYDTFDFTLNGTMPDGTRQVSMRGTFMKGSASDGGGETLYNGTLTRATSNCRDERRFTGARF
jgi:hypothetical protein